MDKKRLLFAVVCSRLLPPVAVLSCVASFSLLAFLLHYCLCGQTRATNQYSATAVRRRLGMDRGTQPSICQLLHRTSPICTAVSCSAPSRIVGFCDLDPFTPLHGLCLVSRGNHIWCSPVLSISYPTRLQTPSACLSRVSGLYAPPLLVNSPSCRLIRP